MNYDGDIPVLTDLIEEEVEVSLPELDPDPADDVVIDDDDYTSTEPRIEAIETAKPEAPIDSTELDPQLEQTIRRILDEHNELAWQEIKLAIQASRKTN